VTEENKLQDEESLSVQPEAPVPPKPLFPNRKYPWAILVVVLLFVLIPFFSWYGSWFGRPLSDNKIEEYLNGTARPRDAQHALSLIGNKIIEGDKSMQRWYPLIVKASHNESAEVRKIAAWAMGQDNKSEEFHAALLPLVKDPNAGVRHNAAVQLVRFNDAGSRMELLAMLEEASLKAESDGTIEFIVEEEGRAVAANSPLARIKSTDGQITEIRSQEAGRIEALAVPDKSVVKTGDKVIVLAPSVEQVREALKALFIVGQTEDIPKIQRYAGPVSGMSDAVQKQAVATLEAIRSRNNVR
jgi:hypothetical protein